MTLAPLRSICMELMTSAPEAGLAASLPAAAGAALLGSAKKTPATAPPTSDASAR
jgi:hypothetical protein